MQGFTYCTMLLNPLFFLILWILHKNSDVCVYSLVFFFLSYDNINFPQQREENPSKQEDL